MKKFLLRVLNKLGLLKYLNLYVDVRMNGQRITVPVISRVGLEMVWSEYDNWMKQMVTSLMKVKRGTFIDVGVNLGQTLLIVKTIDREIPYLGFEPNPACLHYLAHLTEKNDLGHCQIIPAALSKSPEIFSFIASSNTDTAASIVEELRPDKHRFKEQYIAAFPFDQLKKLNNISASVIKVDVEGAELEVILGMENFIRENKPFILCEVLHAHSKEQLEFCRKRNQELMSFLQSIKYNCYRLVKERDQHRVIDLEPITVFDDKTFETESYWMCDYIFIPAEYGKISL